MCPHRTDCLNVGACLDEINAPLIASRQFPRRMTPSQANEFMAALRSGRTLRRITNGGRFGPAIAPLKKFRVHCNLYPEWGVEALRLAKANAKSADSLKGTHLRNLTHCKYGHPLSEARVYHYKGWTVRSCLRCEARRRATVGTIHPEALVKVKAALVAGATVSQITRGQPVGGGAVNRSLKIVDSAVFYHHRRENPEFDRLVAATIVGSNSRGQQIRYARERTRICIAARREEANDYQKIRSMIPAYFPEPDEIVSRVFEDLLSGNLRRDDVRDRVKYYINEHDRMFPTKFRRFGDSPLVSLDELIFDDGSTTRGDTVSRGLWD
jgi:hypothetical protein